jgi:hypothetical protein
MPGGTKLTAGISPVFKTFSVMIERSIAMDRARRTLGSVKALGLPSCSARWLTG